MTRERHVRFCERLGGWFPGPTRLANTPAGARASANLYGLIETAKANAVEPYGYLAHLFTELPQRDLDAGDPVDDLLPWNVDLADPAQS